jgi:hypothetical protein
MAASSGRDEMMRYGELSRHPKVFKCMTGLLVDEFDDLVQAVLPAFGRAEQRRLSQRVRQRAIGAGRLFELAPRDQILLTVVWLRH